MRNPLCYLGNMLRIAGWKMRYGKAVAGKPIQSFERVKLCITHKGRLRFGAYNQNRGCLYLGIDGGELSIGNHCFFNINSSITCLKHIQIGDNCKFGNNLVIVDHDHNYRLTSPEFLTGEISIGNNVWIGAGVTILKDTHIHDNCVIGAGCIVKGNIPEGTKLVQKRVNEITQV